MICGSRCCDPNINVAGMLFLKFKGIDRDLISGEVSVKAGTL